MAFDAEGEGWVAGGGRGVEGGGVGGFFGMVWNRSRNIFILVDITAVIIVVIITVDVMVITIIISIII